ncbi:MAG: glycosyltransferase family 2 protein [Synechococcales cyanobacterium M58_A2018_015]|nr:glycosyltransferase family 2 protein [Synechococcales cyanobacterium M58_A2018_015]
MPFFSVIIPTFNRENLISKALNSVIEQNLDDFEIIVVDDGSTDRTLDVLIGYGSQIKIIQQKNEGPGKARNLGIDNAKGRYIVFLDSDDLWFPWTLSIYKQIITENGFPSLIAGTPIQFHNEDEIKFVQPLPLKIEVFPDYFASSKHSLWLQPGAVAIRADVLRSVGGFTELRINGEDCDLWAKLGTAKGFIYIQTPPVYAYRRHQNSAIANYDKTYQGMFHLIDQEKSSQYPGAFSRQQERLEILTRHIRPVSLKAVYECKFKIGWELYLKTFRWHLYLKRFRYLIAFPIIATLTLFLGLFRTETAPRT